VDGIRQIAEDIFEIVRRWMYIFIEKTSIYRSIQPQPPFLSPLNMGFISFLSGWVVLRLVLNFVWIHFLPVCLAQFPEGFNLCWIAVKRCAVGVCDKSTEPGIAFRLIFEAAVSGGGES